MISWVLFWKICSIALYVANIAIVIYVIIKLILKKTDPIKTLSWILVLILLPYIGVILYLLLGQNYRKKAIFSKKRLVDEQIKKQIATAQITEFKNPDSFVKELYPYRKLISQNLNSDYSILCMNKEVEFFFSGRDALEAMLAEIGKATKHIHLQSFIFLDDTIGKRFKEALIQKAASGVEVRIIVDGAGILGVRRHFFNEMRESGIEVLEFSPVIF